MATKYYVGTDGDFSDTNNWSASRGGAGGAGAPATTDILYIEDLNHAIASGLSQAAVDLGGLYITLAPGGSIGTSSASLTVAVSNVSNSPCHISSRGGGSVYLAAGTNGIDVLQVFSTGAGECVLTGGTTAACIVGPSSSVRVKSGATVSTVVQTGGMVIVESGAGNISGNYYCVNGSATVDDTTIDELFLWGGKLLATGDTNISTQAQVTGGSTYIHRSSGTIAAITVWPNGVASAQSNPYPFTVTASNLAVGGRLFDDATTDITYTAATSYIAFAGG